MRLLFLEILCFLSLLAMLPILALEYCRKRLGIRPRVLLWLEHHGTYADWWLGEKLSKFAPIKWTSQDDEYVVRIPPKETFWVNAKVDFVGPAKPTIYIEDGL